MDTFEHDLTLSSISGIKPIPDFTEKRMDKSLEKRVELHLHTVMSDLDSVVDIKKVINQAKGMGTSGGCDYRSWRIAGIPDRKSLYHDGRTI